MNNEILCSGEFGKKSCWMCPQALHVNVQAIPVGQCHEASNFGVCDTDSTDLLHTYRSLDRLTPKHAALIKASIS
jgi:hypothetical protein